MFFIFYFTFWRIIRWLSVTQYDIRNRSSQNTLHFRHDDFRSRSGNDSEFKRRKWFSGLSSPWRSDYTIGLIRYVTSFCVFWTCSYWKNLPFTGSSSFWNFLYLGYRNSFLKLSELGWRKMFTFCFAGLPYALSALFFGSDCKSSEEISGHEVCYSWNTHSK